MNDFDKLREAAEEIKLDDLQKQKILEACKGKKRRRINYAAIAGIAAMLVISFAVFSPGFLMQAKMADTAENEAAIEDYFLADQDNDSLYSDKLFSQNSSVSGNGSEPEAGEVFTVTDECTQIIFDAEGFRSIYSVIPQSFIALVDYNDFVEWSADVKSENGMAIAQFAEHFGISKEAFDSANRSYAKYIYETYGMMPLYKASYPENEKYEIFKTELIYTSDREAIDGYYRSMVVFPDDAQHSMPAEILVPEDYYK